MSEEPKTQLSESFLGNPDEATLLDAEEHDVPIVKTKSNLKLEAVTYQFFSEFDNIHEMQKQIANREVLLLKL